MPKLIILSLPFLLWIISFLNFYPGNIVLYADAERNFIYTNFFFDQLARGVFPMWNPFHQWGSPDDFGVRVIGEFNPLLYLAFLFHKLGLSMPLSFYLYLLIYFLIGMIGFYLLANRLFDDKRMPLAALILFMFSSIGTNLFNDILVILTLVPSIWFFYFLVKFTKRLDKNSFLGIIYSLMTIAITYLPLYFLTGFLTFLIFFALFYSRDMIGIVKRYFLFARENKFLVSISMFLLGLSIIPGLLWFLAAGMGEYITSWRSFHGEGANAAAMEVGTINLSSLAGPNSFTGLFSNLHYLHAGSIYIPLAVVVIFLLGALVKINRRLLLYLSVSFTIFLISLADVTPVHHFLYTYVPYFKFFRNTHFLFWFAYPFFVLFVVEQLQNLLRLDLTRRWEKGAMLFYVFVVHVGLWLFLLSQDHVINSSYMSVFLSLIFFVTCSSSNFRVPRWAWLLLLGATLIQPLEVFYHLGQIVKDQPSRSAAEVGSAAESKPQFVFFRPKKGEDAALIDHQGLGDSRDTSGFVEGDYVGIKSSYLLQKEIPEDILKEYVRYKILVYDNAARLNGDARDFSLIASAMSGQSNVALVSNDDAHALPEHFNQENNPHPLAITADSLEFQVLAFDLNDIKFKTNFSSDKFLVYNDSFHNDWQARVNGQPVKIFKVNGAFKGLWIRAGENVVYLRFRSETRYLFNFVLLFIFAAFFFYLILDSLGQRKLEKT